VAIIMKPKLCLLLIPFLLACNLSAALPANLAAVPANTPMPAVQPTETADRQQATVTAAESLNVRSEPSYTSPVIGYLKHGEAVTVYECVGNWARVGVGEFVNAVYLSGDVCPKF
jgi:uncharacterized protein YgiM (DUF1202 family)